MVGGDQERGQLLHARRHGLCRELRARARAVVAARAGMAHQRGRLAVHESRLPAHGSLAGSSEPQAFRRRQRRLPDRRRAADGERRAHRLRRYRARGGVCPHAYDRGAGRARAADARNRGRGRPVAHRAAGRAGGGLPAHAAHDLRGAGDEVSLRPRARTPVRYRGVRPAGVLTRRPRRDVAMSVSPTIEITYCRLGGWGLRATWMAQELLTTFAEELGSVTLTPDATGGVFEVRVDDELVWSRKEQGRFPEIRELKQLVRDRVAPGRSLGHSDAR